MERIDHILVVDDDRDIRELIVDYLEKSGYRASGAANGKAMWSVLKNHQIDLIVLDIMMPGEDGLTLCRQLRANPQQDIPLLLSMYMDGKLRLDDMVTKRYAHILDEDRRRLADEMEQSFYKGKTEEAPVTAAPALDAEALASLLASNPELLKKALEPVQLANNT